MELIRSYYFHQRRPSPNTRWVGSCINRFEACSAFTHVTACMLAKSPTRPSTPEAPTASFPSPPLRLLPGGANQFPGGTFTRSEPAPFTAHATSGFNANDQRTPGRTFGLSGFGNQRSARPCPFVRPINAAGSSDRSRQHRADAFAKTGQQGASYRPDPV